jgi:hypothetical protein
MGGLPEACKHIAVYVGTILILSSYIFRIAGDLDSDFNHPNFGSPNNTLTSPCLATRRKRWRHLLFVKDNQPNPGLWAVPFSFSKLRVTGKPFLVHANVLAASIALDGDLIYMPTTSENSQELLWVDRVGKILGALGSPKDDMRDPVISPNGQQVAVGSGGDRYGIWVMDSTRNTATSLAGGIFGAAFPAWLLNGKSMAVVCWFSEKSESSVCAAPADGSGKFEPILTVDKDLGLSVSPDQKSILFAKRNKAGNFEIWRTVFQKDATPEPFLATQFNELAPRISPDGHYVAYQSDESGRYEVYVRPYPAGDGRCMISTNGGTTPKWSAKGDELFYLQNDTLQDIFAVYAAAHSLLASNDDRTFLKPWHCAFQCSPMKALPP